MSGAHAFVGGEHDAQAVDRILHVIRQIDVLLDGAEQERLFAVAQSLMIGLVLGVDQLVRLHELVVLVDVAVVQLDAVRLGVAVDVVRAFGGWLRSGP